VDELKTIVVAIGSVPDQLRAQINALGAEAQQAVPLFAGKPMLTAASIGRTWDDSRLYLAPTFVAPDVVMPAMSTTTGYDEPSVPYGALADKVVSDLTAAVDPSQFPRHCPGVAGERLEHRAQPSRSCIGSADGGGRLCLREGTR